MDSWWGRWCWSPYSLYCSSDLDSEGCMGEPGPGSSRWIEKGLEVGYGESGGGRSESRPWKQSVSILNTFFNVTALCFLQPGESPSRDLLRDCENPLWNRWILCSTTNITHGNTFCRSDHVYGNYCVDNYGSETLFRGRAVRWKLPRQFLQYCIFLDFENREAWHHWWRKEAKKRLMKSYYESKEVTSDLR